jgi:CBS domain-containing protein
MRPRDPRGTCRVSTGTSRPEPGGKGPALVVLRGERVVGGKVRDEASRASDFWAFARSGPPVADLEIAPLPAVPLHLSMAFARKVAALTHALMLSVECEGVLLGLLDQRALFEAADEAVVATVMEPVSLCLDYMTPVAEARELFIRSGVAALPVVAGRFVLGMMSRTVVEWALASRSISDETANGIRARAVV